MSIDFNKRINFGMAIKSTQEVNAFLERNLSNKAANKLMKIIEQEVKNPVDVRLALETREKCLGYNSQYVPIIETYKDVFVAKVEDKVFKKSIFSSCVGVVEDAVRYARKISENREILKSLGKLD